MIKHTILISVVTGFVITLLSLSGIFSKGKVEVKDAAGQPVAGASVWVSRISAPSAPEFITNHKGVAWLTVKNYGNVAAIIATKDNLHGSVSAEHITWPLRVTISPR